MAKNPIDWHRRGLASLSASLAEREAKLARQIADMERTRAARDLLRRQIAEAERRGLDGFDADRLLIKRRA